MSELIKHITDDSFEADVINATGPVLVDFWAEWCGPCKMIAPVLEELSTEYEGRVQITKIDVDSNRGSAEKYGVRGIHTLMLFDNGEAKATKVGALNKSQLAAFLEEQL